MVSYYGRNVMIDCGEDSSGEAAKVNPHAIVITYAHPEHPWGLKQGAPAPVYAPAPAWEHMRSYPIEERHTLEIQRPVEVEGIRFQAFAVEHSERERRRAYGRDHPLRIANRYGRRTRRQRPTGNVGRRTPHKGASGVRRNGNELAVVF